MAVNKKRRKKGISFTVLVVLTVVFSTLVGAVAWGVDFYREIKNPNWQVSTPSPTITPSNTPNGMPSGMDTGGMAVCPAAAAGPGRRRPQLPQN